VTRYTRRFWYEVKCALLVQRGAPYCRRYVAGHPVLDFYYCKLLKGINCMSKNTKTTSEKVASKAAKILADKNTSKTAKSLAASALSQKDSQKQTGSELEDLASKVLRSEKYNADTKELAASVLAQSNKNR